ncbi:putative entry exclusion protein TrbK-alt [Bradyrhizobium sp. AUGA SZCCT0160]|uniref:putative entry exclusion protein TrbK-alt n=1 Tax=Bradyrhizobium sp. AUGA SZCCT0160 TaxID=2807662 RepID=UPI001BA4EEB8|nr:putative entry exclusion protein TrbK-alt [Bradyrhizobium sp. AUGA SZCCT0160]MBR1187363.1 putative entry exclusion protein TrbK-alt [Bradyrhizobium sp. AUGA SZCCT0160]
MTDVRAFKALSLATTVVVLVVAASTIHLRGGEESAPLKAQKTSDADDSDLVRCRNVTLEEATTRYHHCQEIWAKNRCRFFGKKDGAAVSGRGDPASGLTPAPKDQSRMPQGYPSVAIPEVSKP